MRTLICYDISDDKRRRKVMGIMEGYGYRVQYSVFECDLDRRKTAELKRRLRPLVSKKEWESVRIYPLCADCQKKRQIIGKDTAQYLEPVEIV